MRRLALLCEVLRPPLDEGIRIVAAELAVALGRGRAITLMGEADAEIRGVPVRGVLTDRWFAGRALARAMAAARPEAILYVPWTSLTARTFARVAALRRRAPGAAIGVIALQPRDAGVATRALARWGRPDCLFAFGPRTARQAEALGLRCDRMEGGVDVARFRPARAEEVADLRRAIGLPVSPYIVLHVGHLKTSRGVLALRSLQALQGVQAVLVASTSTDPDPAAGRALRDAGVRVVDRHVERIEEYYRAADAYVFPTASSLDAIELPLSVLEAMACDLPIVATRFGGLAALLEGAGEGVALVAGEIEIPGVVQAFRRDRPRPSLRGRIAGLTWEALAGRIAEALDRAGAERRGVAPPEARP